MDGSQSWVKLEERFGDIVDGTIVDVVIQVSLQHPGFVAGTTILHNQCFLTDVKIPAGFFKATLYRVCKQTYNGTIWLQSTDHTSVEGHRPFSVNQLQRMNETCSGMGFVDGGYEACGVTISSLDDTNIRFSQWAHNHGRKVITGDICLSSTVQQIAKQQRGSLSSGVSCQPWSTLGDMKGGSDMRAQSLPGTLKAAHLLQVPVLIIECTKVAATAEWVQGMLAKFCQETGYIMHQKILSLDEIWISQRTRWWTTISHPSLGVKEIPDLPELAFKPSFLHVFPKLIPMTPEEEEEIALDRYELRQFYTSKGGITKHLVNYAKPLPTATHSWGSQVKGCKCGCRVGGFSFDRLESKGLYAQIFPIEGKVDMGDFVADRMRHMHPSEVALANGIQPQLVGTPGFLRLELARVGQCASPLQSLWVYSNLLRNVQERFGLVHPVKPIELLKEYGRKLFESRDQVLQVTTPKTKYMKLFEEAWESLGGTDPKANPQVTEEFSGDVGGDDCNKKKDESKDSSANQGSVTSGNDQQQVKQDEPQIELVGQHMKQSLKRKHESEPSPPKVFPEDFDVALLNHVKNAEKPGFRHNQKEEFDLGGVPGFESSKRQKMDRGKGKGVPNNRAGSSYPVTTLEVEEDGQSAKRENGTACTKGGEKPSDHPDNVDDIPVAPLEIFVIRPNQHIQTIQFRGTVTGNNLLQASLEESEKTHHLYDAMGCEIKKDDRCVDGQFVMIGKNDASNSPPLLINDTRLTLLWQQQGWVEKDEMQKYLAMLEARFPNQVQQSLCLPNDPSAGPVLGTRILDMAHAAVQSQVDRIATSVLYKNHWAPMILLASGEEVEIHTSLEFVPILKTLCSEFWDNTLKVIGFPVPQVFANDCGFQSLGWIETKLQHDQVDCTFTSQMATKHRWEYHEHVLRSTGDQMVHQALILGGTRQTMESLQKLIEEHGVAVERSQECALNLVSKLGNSTVEQILRAPKPWSDLKARTNLLQPPLKIVTSQELQDMIKKRTADGKPMGSKSNKKKQQNEIVELKSHQLSIPHAVFKQSDGEEIGQIYTSQIQNNSQGIVLANIDEAIPFFALTSVVSMQGVGLLVLEFDDPRIPSAHEVIRVPATCNATGEPMLLTAALLQLGGKQVSRNVPAKCLEIKEVENAVLKVLVYKDQYPKDWEAFIDKPVRQLLQTAPFDAVSSQEVLDVWDRQYLNHRLSKTSVRDATLFAVCIRVTSQAAGALMDHSGKDGLYLEPRNPTGRLPDPSCQVVWLHKKTYPEAMLAKQTTPNGPTLVRSGDRWFKGQSSTCRKCPFDASS